MFVLFFMIHVRRMRVDAFNFVSGAYPVVGYIGMRVTDSCRGGRGRTFLAVVSWDFPCIHVHRFGGNVITPHWCGGIVVGCMVADVVIYVAVRAACVFRGSGFIIILTLVVRVRVDIFWGVWPLSPCTGWRAWRDRWV